MHVFLSNLAQTLGLLLFILAFVLVLIYALNPGNRKVFDRASQLPLDEEANDDVA
ncbi:MAG: cbb3-type cytochrome c oxidase subunit 3 [Pseudomonadota bacterium]